MQRFSSCARGQGALATEQRTGWKQQHLVIITRFFDLHHLYLYVQDDTHGEKQNTDHHTANQYGMGNICVEHNYIFHSNDVVEIHHTIIVHRRGQQLT